MMVILLIEILSRNLEFEGRKRKRGEWGRTFMCWIL